MSEKNIVKKSILWSFFTVGIHKLIIPISNMILARVLDPSAFGVVAVANMIISFIDIITDSGFCKYLVHKDFKDEREKYEYANVSFWTNMLISTVIFILIVTFKDLIAQSLGAKKYALVISISSIQILVTAFSSIQNSLLSRSFQFKKLFFVRLIISSIPLVVTVPLALIYKSYWALIVGNLIGAISNSLILSLISEWKPGFYYNISHLKNMWKYSIWSLFEALGNWSLLWVDTFIIGSYFTEYQLGLYKNSSSMAMSLVGLISTAMSPVLFSTLSRLKNDNNKLINRILDINSLLLYLLVPITIGLFLYSQSATLILFGNRWIEASNIVGLWGIIMLFNTIFYSIPAELYKSKGLPKVLFLFQVNYLLFLFPLLIYGAKIDFSSFLKIRVFAILIQLILSLIYLKKYYNIGAISYIKSFINPILISFIIIIVYLLIPNKEALIVKDLIKIAISAILYLFIAFIFFKKKIRDLLVKIG